MSSPPVSAREDSFHRLSREHETIQMQRSCQSRLRPSLTGETWP